MEDWKKEIENRFTKIILEECNSNKEVKEREKFYIKKFDAFLRQDFYNRTPGGDGIDYESMTEEQREYFLKRMSQRVKEGWENKSEESKEKYKSDCACRMTNRWKNLSKEDLTTLRNNIGKGQKKRYAKMTEKERTEYCKFVKEVAVKREKNMSVEALRQRGQRISEGQKNMSGEQKEVANKKRSASMKKFLSNPEAMEKRTKYKNRVIAINKTTLECTQFDSIYEASCFIGDSKASSRIYKACCKPYKYAYNQSMERPKMIGYSGCGNFSFIFADKQDIELYSLCDAYPTLEEIVLFLKNNLN